jgi:hypothetical protein
MIGKSCTVAVVSGLILQYFHSNTSCVGGGVGEGDGEGDGDGLGDGVGLGVGAAQATATIIRARQTLPSNINIFFLVISISFHEFSQSGI